MNINDKYRLLKDTVLSFLKDEDVKIFIFGSRARKDYHDSSDIDIGLIPKKNIRIKTVLLKEKIEEINIPYKVDIIDFSETGASFKKEALKDIIIWKD